ncbi:MAG TPA: hypothetical protein VH853_00305 [Polyangia bacterium]|nr:hypothetical protein [Polyangia bacterium]
MRFLATMVPLAAVAVAVTAAGCGGSNGSATGSGGNSGTGSTGGALAADGAVPMTTSGPYQPLSVGTTWVYNVTDTGVAYVKNSAVLAYEDIGGIAAGIMGYKVSETIKTSTQLTWYEVTATDVRRHHDQQVDSNGIMSSEDWYTPYDLRVDESPDHLVAGAAWSLSYMDAHTSASKPPSNDNITENWTTDAVNEVVTEPAGTFNALKITRTNTADGTAKSQWYVQGVGKIRESNTTGHLEELTSYSIAATNGGG